MGTAMSVTRGIRNNNPGNIERNPANAWQGRMPADRMTAAQKAEPRFEVFASASWGIRALAILLINYFDRYGCNTVFAIINRWAPAIENDTSAYVAAVAQAVRVDPHAALNLHDYAVLCPLLQGIIAHENAGYRYPPEVVEEGLRLAGVVKPDVPLVPHPAAAQTATAAALATGGTAAVVTSVTTVMPAIQSVQQVSTATQGLPPSLRVIVLLMIAASAGATLYAWYRLRRAAKVVAAP